MAKFLSGGFSFNAKRLMTFHPSTISRLSSAVNCHFTVSQFSRSRPSFFGPLTRRISFAMVVHRPALPFSVWQRRLSSMSGNDDGNSEDNNQPQTSDPKNIIEVETLKTDSSDNVSSNLKPVSDTEVDQELLRYDYEIFELKPDEEVEVVKPMKKLPISLDRGTTGVFDVEELVELLREENGRDICVIHVPKELDFVDYMVLVTGRSTRHLRAMAEYIKWTFKRKRSEKDRETVKIEGELTNDWFALDLGNIAVHLFLRDTRRLYDLETLWTVGVEHDEKSRQQTVDELNAMQRQDFSFDLELERLRTLRSLPPVGVGATKGKNRRVRGNDEPAVQLKTSLENASNWHQVPNTS